MIRITKLHLLFFVLIVSLTSLYIYHFHQELKHKREQQAIDLQKAEDLKKQEEEKRRKEEIELQRKVAIDVIAVAGEYWLLSKEEGRDISKGQESLHEAKENLNQNNLIKAIELARISIAQLKEAQLKNIVYKVKRGDCLWKIAAMPRHYGNGLFWRKIWLANKAKIHNYRLIYPRQIFKIPK